MAPTNPLANLTDDDLLKAAKETPSKMKMAELLSCHRQTLDKKLKQRGLERKVKILLADEGGAETTATPRNPTPEVEREKVEPEPDVVGATPDVGFDIGRIYRSAAARFEATAKRAEEKQHQKIRFPHGPVCLFFVGDQHFGAAGVDVERAYAEQELMMETPGGYVIQTGDVVENMIVGRLVAENMKPSLPIQEQWALAKDYLHGFSGRLLAHVGGNHDGGWSVKMSGIDYARDITPKGILYDSDELRADIHVGNKVWALRSRHRYMGHSMYNPTHGLERAARFDTPSYDIFTGAHVHLGGLARDFSLEGRRKMAILSGTYKAHDSFAREVGFPGTDHSTAVALILNDSGSAFATADLRAAQEYQSAVYKRR